VAGAAVAGAEAAATAADPGREEVEAPALVAVRAQFFLIGAVRLLLAAAGLAAAIARGTSPGVAAGLFGLGAGVLLLAVVGGRGTGAWERIRKAQPLPTGARIESRGRSVVRAAYPSTIGLSVLIILALVIDSALAAVLAGILGGIGGVALGFAAQLAVWEQRRRARVFAEPRSGGRIYEAQR
jgi:hypothetical protein